MKLKHVFLIVVLSSVSAIASMWVYTTYFQKKNIPAQIDGKLPANYAGFLDGNVANVPEEIDFTKAANTTVQAVVHIKTKIPARKISNGNELPRRNRGIFDDWFDQFFDMNPMVIPEQRASGSGVLISEDGYIVTNNHVVSDDKGLTPDEITVTLHNKKTFKARVIGKDPSSDLAVLKIDGHNFPYLIYGNSDEVQLGQWVLAVGYPLTLETTVTAGIVSAKGRNIGINARQSDSPIESFIQTDAAVNQGNSGGALVTTDGKLVGINSAILAPSGTYAGYSFAIPVNLAKKIVNDLIKYGDVKRPFLGVTVEENKFDANDGAHIGKVSKDGPAEKAGLKSGDIITRINTSPVNSWTELQAAVSSFNVDEKVNLTYKRNGKDYNTAAVLKAREEVFDVFAVENIGDKLGAELETLDSKTAAKYDVDGGVVVKKIKEDGKLSRSKMDEGFVITSVNSRSVKSVEELSSLLTNLYGGTVRLEGFYPGYRGTYTYPLNLND